MQETEQELQHVGAHYALSRRHRHPSTIPFISVDQRTTRSVFDLTILAKQLDGLLTFMQECGKKKSTILFATSRHESLKLVEETATALGMPFVTGRWVGGLLSNFDVIKKRVERLKKLRGEKEINAWQKYTKKEGVLLQRELGKLETRFSGILQLEKLPDVLFVVNTQREKIAVAEARKVGIPIVGLVNACVDISTIDYPVVTNINSLKNIQYILDKVQQRYRGATTTN